LLIVTAEQQLIQLPDGSRAILEAAALLERFWCKFQKRSTRTQVPWEKGSHLPAKSDLNLNFAPEPLKPLTSKATTAPEIWAAVLVA
jgi:hypothetical protein